MFFLSICPVNELLGRQPRLVGFNVEERGTEWALNWFVSMQKEAIMI